MDTLPSQLSVIIERFREAAASLRTGRATPALVENIDVDYYGTRTPLKAIASISSPEARQLVIKPWDKNALPAIEKAISASNLGFAPIADKETVRISIPQLTEERRKEFVKLLGKHMEDTRIQVRKKREDALRNIDRKEKNSELSEDEKFRAREAIQKQVDETNKKIEDIGEQKEKEIMTV